MCYNKPIENNSEVNDMKMNIKRILAAVLVAVMLSAFAVQIFASIDLPDIPFPSKGDINNDGEITTADVLLARKYAAGIEIPKYMLINMGDVDGDGDITLADVLIIRKYVAGLIDSVTK